MAAIVQTLVFIRLRVIAAARLVRPDVTAALVAEAHELVAILTAIVRKSRAPLSEF